MSDKLKMFSDNLQFKFERRFLLADLPVPLTRASEHLQFFDNYLTNTQLFLQRVREPKTKEWTRKIIKKYPVAPPDATHLAVAEIVLSEYEYEVLAIFEGNELRYNRYFLNLEDRNEMMIDMYLNRELWNLIVATVAFNTREEMLGFIPPPFAAREITQNELFTGGKLSNSSLYEIQKVLNF